MINKKVSISIPISGKLLKDFYNLSSNLEKNFFINSSLHKSCRPHINVFSGKIKKIEFINKLVLNELKKFKKENIIFIGYGAFLNKKTTIFLRFKNNAFFKNLRKILFKKNFLWKSIDKTVDTEVWIPKCTLINENLEKKKINEIIKLINKKKISKKMKINELSIIDFTKKQKEILKFKF